MKKLDHHIALLHVWQIFFINVAIFAGLILSIVDHRLPAWGFILTMIVLSCGLCIVATMTSEHQVSEIEMQVHRMTSVEIADQESFYVREG